MLSSTPDHIALGAFLGRGNPKQDTESEYALHPMF